MQKTITAKALVAILMIFQFIQPDNHTIYSHGIVDGPHQINRFDQAIETDNTTAVAFDDTNSETGYGINRIISEISTRLGKPVNRSKMYMGQAQDIQTIHQAVQKVPADNETILYGCSRGAATLINYMAQHNPQQVKAMVLDATPSNMPQATHTALAKLGLHQSWDKSLFRTIFPAYPCDATAPVDAIQNIKNKALPILLIHSQQDSKVPFVNSLQLYREFKQQGFKYVHLAAIPTGRHSFLLQDDTVKDRYLQAVHSFYKAYNLPHNPEHATADIKQYDYDLQKASQEIATYQQALQKQYEDSHLRNLYIAAVATIATLAAAAYKYQQ